MNWEKLKQRVYAWDDSWRDIYVHGTSPGDWDQWAQFVNQHYRIDWYNGKTQKDEVQIDFEVIKAFWSGDTDLSSTAKVFLNDRLQVNAHFFEPGTLENDIDPRDFKSLADHGTLMNYMKGVSELLNKTVTLTPENCPEIKLIIVDGTAVEISTDTDPSDWPVHIKK